jgi:hypothetical protein
VSVDRAPNLFGAVDDDAMLIAAYERAGRTLDDLAYTEQFERVFAELGGEGAGLTRWGVLHRLQNLRKANRLPRLGKASTPPVRVTEDEERLLASLVELEAGSLGQRDAIVYTTTYDRVVASFNERTGRSLSAHDLWRLVAKLAK